MRSFRSNRVNLRDTRIAYTFLLLFTLICAILGMTVTELGSELRGSRLEGCYEALSLCADALEAWRTSDSAEDRYAASLRLETAAARLPSEVELEPIMSLADHMRMGESAAERVRTFADTFALLASIDYADEAEARRIIAETLDGVDSAMVSVPTETASVTATLQPEVLEYSKKTVQKSIKKLFGANASALDVVLSDDGGSWTAETENLRMSFSSTDGSLDGFVYIRIGSKPSVSASEGEQLAAALDFYRSTHRGAPAAEVNAVGSTCGFAVCEIADGGERWQVTIDSHGRVWSLVKVKR